MEPDKVLGPRTLPFWQGWLCRCRGLSSL